MNLDFDYYDLLMIKASLEITQKESDLDLKDIIQKVDKLIEIE